MDILDDAGDGLMLVQDAVNPEAPDGGAAERGEQHPTHAVAERVAEAALERLEPELGRVGMVLALRHLDKLRADQPAKIDRVCHGEVP